MEQSHLNKGLEQYLEGIETEFEHISGERKEALHRIADYLEASAGKETSLVFICTHNSRRSQFGQIWAETAARYYGFENIRTYSGGTESTAFNPRAVAALERAGFSADKNGPEENPVYRLSAGKDIPATDMFSKKYGHESNPAVDFCAIMVCSDADEACPFVPGAAERISLPYDDPKAFDGTDQESRKYDERCREMARDLFYVFHRVTRK
jgi:protein-tyrosine-phosphatase